MSEPSVELDARYSEAGASALPWADARRALQEAQLCWVTTVRPDGIPHSTPLVAPWLDEALHFSTGALEQKGRNLAGNPHVLLSTGDMGWQGGVNVVVEGEAVRVTDRPTLTRLAEAWRAKWDGRWEFEVGGDGFGRAQVFRVEARVAWAYTKAEEFSHTRYTF